MSGGVKVIGVTDTTRVHCGDRDMPSSERGELWANRGAFIATARLAYDTTRRLQRGRGREKGGSG